MTRRAAYEARQRRRANIIAGFSTVAVVGLVMVLVPLAPGWEAVKRSFFDGETFVRTFPTLLRAFLLDVAIFAWSVPLIFALGLAIALARGARAA
ncbi:MAG: amino acid ABC transporter permease, partial [Pseudomonadota bacterium]